MPTIISGDTGIDKIAAGAIEYADLPTGSVLQVVSATSSAQFSTSSTSFTTTNFSVSITPKFSTSKILIQIIGGMFSGNSGQQLAATIYRGATNLGTSTGLTEQYGSASNWQVPSIVGVYDSPATTSATTYTLYIKANTGTVYFNQDPTLATIIATEIAA